MKKTLAIIGLIAASLAGARGQVLISSLNTAYTQNFDGLGTGNVTWSDNTTLAGWYMNSSNSLTTLTASTGSSTTGTVYNYGAASGSDRAIGYLGSSGNTHTNYFVLLQNTTGATVASLNISYDGELWRSGGAQPTNSNNLFTFSYATGSPTLPTNGSQTGWTTITALNYAPAVSVAAGAQGGVATHLSYSVTGLNLANNAGIYLRWYGNDGSGTDAGLAIDNFSVTAIPEPKPCLLAGIGFAFALWNLRRRRDVES